MNLKIQNFEGKKADKKKKKRPEGGIEAGYISYVSYRVNSIQFYSPRGPAWGSLHSVPYNNLNISYSESVQCWMVQPMVAYGYHTGKLNIYMLLCDMIFVFHWHLPHRERQERIERLLSENLLHIISYFFFLLATTKIFESLYGSFCPRTSSIIFSPPQSSL